MDYGGKPQYPSFGVRGEAGAGLQPAGRGLPARRGKRRVLPEEHPHRCSWV